MATDSAFIWPPYQGNLALGSPFLSGFPEPERIFTVTIGICQAKMRFQPEPVASNVV